MVDAEYNVFTGSTTGVIKGVTLGENNAAGSVTVCTKTCLKGRLPISNENEISVMNWVDDTEDSILIGVKGKILVYNVLRDEAQELALQPKDVVRGICCYERSLIYGLETGEVKFFAHPYEENTAEVFKTMSSNLSCLKQNKNNRQTVVTGGKENDLKIWDVSTKECVFSAKNIKPDELQLAVPIWVSDICFPLNSVAYCSRHGHVRLFDLSLPQRRPVVNAYMPNKVFTCITTAPRDYQLIVGSGDGDLDLVDTRGKGLFVGKYKGFSGCVKSITCTDREKLLISVSLDRHFRVHDFLTRNLRAKEYFQSRLTAVLARSNFKMKNIPKSEENQRSSYTEEVNTFVQRRKKRRTDQMN